MARVLPLQHPGLRMGRLRKWREDKARLHTLQITRGRSWAAERSGSDEEGSGAQTLRASTRWAVWGHKARMNDPHGLDGARGRLLAAVSVRYSDTRALASPGPSPVCRTLLGHR